jgi:hypothetical protein
MDNRWNDCDRRTQRFKFMMRINRVHFGLVWREFLSDFLNHSFVTSGNRCMALRRSSVDRCV